MDVNEELPTRASCTCEASRAGSAHPCLSTRRRCVVECRRQGGSSPTGSPRRRRRSAARDAAPGAGFSRCNPRGPSRSPSPSPSPSPRRSTFQIHPPAAAAAVAAAAAAAAKKSARVSAPPFVSACFAIISRTAASSGGTRPPAPPVDVPYSPSSLSGTSRYVHMYPPESSSSSAESNAPNVASGSTVRAKRRTSGWS